MNSMIAWSLAFYGWLTHDDIYYKGFIGMQVELYFGEDDACSSVEYYSPRNEVEALNSILSLLDISLSSGMCMQMNVLQELREAIIGMIRDFGEKNSVKTTILENHSCDKEECLLQWGENNGIRTRLQIACKSSQLWLLLLFFSLLIRHVKILPPFLGVRGFFLFLWGGVGNSGGWEHYFFTILQSYA